MVKYRLRAAVLFALVLIGGLVFSPVPGALAHAEPGVTVPAIGSTVDQAPPVVEITFTEEVTEATTIEVIGPDGKAVNSAPAALDLQDAARKHVTVTLYGALPAGVYTVNWTSVSAEDGDPDSGSYTFTVAKGVATPVASPVASPESSPVAAAASTGNGEAPKDQVNAAAEAAQQAATAQAAAEDNFDGSSYLISVLAGVAGAIVIYLFWRRMRPKPNERYVVPGPQS